MKTLKIIKIGGHIIDNSILLGSFLKDFAKLKGPKLLVHGGGKIATKVSKKMHIKPNLIDGRRITDQDTLDIITMVYAGKINKKIITKLQSYGCNSIGLSGADGNTIIAKKRAIKSIDFGYVGDIVEINTKTIELLLDAKITPVFCPISHDKKAQLFNTNADTIASTLAVTLSQKFNVQLYYCIEHNGVLENKIDKHSVIPEITTNNYEQLKAEGIIYDGMLPKIENCLTAKQNNVQKVQIGNIEMPFNKKISCTTLQL